jgi:hypothetical protein
VKRIAGVRFDAARIVWVDVGSHEVSLLDEVVVKLDEGSVDGLVVVTPEQLLNPGDLVDGTITRVQPRKQAADLPTLPGSDMPYLGSLVGSLHSAGVVVGINPVTCTATIKHHAGTLEELPIADLSKLERE